jgi:integrase
MADMGVRTMAVKLTDKIMKTAAPPEKGNRIIWDTAVRGFGGRITAAGSRAFVLNYKRKSDGLERRWTLGSFPDWGTAAAREEASRLKRAIDGGADPVGEHSTDRASPTVSDLCGRFTEEYMPRLRASTRGDYETLIRLHIKPALSRHKAAAVHHNDVAALHRRVSTTAPHQANRVAALLSRMFTLAIKWGWRLDNPAKGIERNPEEKRHRYLSAAELTRLSAARAKHPDCQAANIFRLLLLTGARRFEVQSMKWEDLDPAAGIWTKAASTTKQRALHRVPLSAPARQLLAGLAEAESENLGPGATSAASAGSRSEYVFPGRLGGHRVEIKDAWRDVCRSARINGLRIHDLRHSFASQAVGAGLSLPVVGALLGHAQPSTTHRYAHLADDRLRAAIERVGAIIDGGPSADVELMKGDAA